MKKLFLVSAIVMGAATASQAGVHLSFGISLPLPGVVIGQRAPVVCAPAPVYVARAPVYYQAPPMVYYQAPAPVCYSAPPVVYAPSPACYFGYGAGWHGRRHWGWDRR